MLNKQPTHEELKRVVKNSIFVMCPQLLIDTLVSTCDSDFFMMHDIVSDDEDALPPEIYEYYLVDGWFGKGLEGIGQPTMCLEPGLWLWGRTSTGLDLEYDAVVADVIMYHNKRSVELLQKF